MKKQIVIALLLMTIVLLSGCISDECPSNYTVSNSDRVRCYIQKEAMPSCAVFDLNIGCEGTIEVDCPNACVNSVR